MADHDLIPKGAPPPLSMTPAELLTWLDILNRNAEALLRAAPPTEVRLMHSVCTHLSAAQANLHRVIAGG